MTPTRDIQGLFLGDILIEFCIQCERDTYTYRSSCVDLCREKSPTAMLYETVSLNVHCNWMHGPAASPCHHPSPCHPWQECAIPQILTLPSYLYLVQRLFIWLNPTALLTPSEAYCLVASFADNHPAILCPSLCQNVTCKLLLMPGWWGSHPRDAVFMSAARFSKPRERWPSGRECL